MEGAAASDRDASASSSPAKRLPTAPFFPAPARQPRRIPVQRSEGSTESDERRSAQLKARRLEEELQDLREAYAKKIAYVELKCEKTLREKDEEKDGWYKEKRQDIAQMSAAVTIMKALFDKTSARLWAKMRADKQELEGQQEAFRKEAEYTKKQLQEALEAGPVLVRETKAKCDKFEQELSQLGREKSQCEEANKRLEEQVTHARNSNAKLTEASEALRRETEQLRRKLLENESKQELARRDAQIESLEQELERTRKETQESTNAQIEGLQKELMDYVAWIVRTMPADGLSIDGMPKEVKDRVNLQSAGAFCAAPGDSPERCLPAVQAPQWPAPQSPRSLPPVSSGKRSSRGQWRPRTPDTYRPRAR